MTGNYYRTGNYKVDHTTFGGELSLFDFEGHRTLSNMAEKIASDLRFDETCHKNWENNKNKKGVK